MSIRKKAAILFAAFFLMKAFTLSLLTTTTPLFIDGERLSYLSK
ncbi:hypothetical protein [Yersinia ruckeri]|uniref:Uncharacterized protein n=1 Tax=Yersinia ruckeri TaxID=29486 RepID=A0A0A8VD31_YERRU|nr:Uncharacterized protein YR821_0052 [Yersinia ruckeri]CEK25889.1 hypothetical protein CSF007_0470 [Yersinia ruckeri]